MREVNLAGLDLNLLPTLEALLRRRNVTHAAAEVGLIWRDICGTAPRAYVERPRGQALFSDISSSGIGAVICPAFQRGRGPLASMKFAMRGADQSDAL
jgi:hypothetical protein